MGTYQIVCIKKDDRKNPYERIQSVGLDGVTQRYSQPEIVRMIDSGGHRFYVNRGGSTVDVITATSPFGNRYIKTRPDGNEPNNLLSLPECRN